MRLSDPRFLVLAAAAALASPPAAGAATVEMTTEHVGTYAGEDEFQQNVTYTAAPGEANSVVVRLSHEEVVYEDAGAEIEARRGCVNTSPRRAVCRPPDGFGTIRTLLEDRDDRIEIVASESAPVTEVDAGTGNDVVHGGRGSQNLSGGPGDDLVDGGPGGDTINGGGGRDELRAGDVADGFDFIEDGDTDGTADADLIVGHAGEWQTTVSYRARSRPVVVNLAAGTGGARGEGDSLIGITHLEGGKGDDILRGTGADDFIRGNEGADVIKGEDGNDGLAGQGGADRVFGGPGDDTLRDDSDDALDRHNCGVGTDLVYDTDARDRLHLSCEHSAWAVTPVGDVPQQLANRITARPRLRPRVAVFRSTCVYIRDCTGRITLRTPKGRQLLGAGRIRLERSPAGRERWGRIKVRLNRRGYERMRRGGWVRVVISARFECGCLNPPKPAKNGFTTFLRR